MFTIFFFITGIIIFFLIRKHKNHFYVKEYNFIKITSNWYNNYSNYYFNNIPLYNFDNKYETYKLMKNLGIRTPKLYFYGNYNNYKNKLLNKKHFVIKPIKGHSSNNVFLVSNNINMFTKKRITYDKLDTVFNNKIVMIEEFLKDNYNNYTIPDDYKLYTFKGNVEIILHKFNKNNKYYCNTYDRNLKQIKNINKTFISTDNTIDKKSIKKIIKKAEKIGKTVFNNVFVRLDFYLSQNKPVLGEITPCPCGALCFTNEGKKILNSLCKKHDLYY